MLLSASGTYLLVAFIAAAASYVLAHRKGLNAVGWAWASLFLIVPALILPFVRTRQTSAPSAGIPDANWRALLAYDPEIKAAVARLAPFGAPAVDDLRRSWEAVPNKDALPEMMSDIEARWSAYASAGLTHVETRDGVAVLQDAVGRYHVDGRQTADLGNARLLASAGARRARTRSLVGTVIVGAAVLATVTTSAGPARAQGGRVAMTLPSCEAYQRERPRGGPFEQLSDLFGLSIYRWDEGDYGRYRNFLLDCKRSLPSFREDVTLRDWEALAEKSVAGLKSYTGYVNRLGEPMANRRGPRPATGAPDYTRAFETLSCDRFTQATVNTWARGGPSDYGPETPFSVPFAKWTYEVWRALENRIVSCGQQTGSPVEADRDWISAVVSGMEGRASGEIRQAQQDEGTRATKTAGILARLPEAESLSAADEIAAKLKAVETLTAAGPKLGRADEEQVAAARERVAVRLRAARTAEAEAWERDRPAREARARQQEDELAGLQRQNREREAQATGERERAARIEAERQAQARVEAERQAAETEARRQRDDAQRVADRQAQEKADAETLVRIQREDRARLASDPCNKVEMRRQMMDAANEMDRARYGGNRLLDLTDGRSLPADAATTRSCLFAADWSFGRRGLVTITVRKNSFGDDLIEVKPF